MFSFQRPLKEDDHPEATLIEETPRAPETWRP